MRDEDRVGYILNISKSIKFAIYLVAVKAINTRAVVEFTKEKLLYIKWQPSYHTCHPKIRAIRKHGTAANHLLAWLFQYRGRGFLG